MEQRNPLSVLGLSVVTFGIYGLYWVHQTNKDIQKQEIETMPFLFFFIPIAGLIFLFKYFAGAERFTQGRINGILYAVIWMGLALLAGIANIVAISDRANINWVLVFIAWVLLCGVFALLAFTQKQYNTALEAERSFVQAANPLPPSGLPPGSPPPGYSPPPGMPPSLGPPPPGMPPSLGPSTSGYPPPPSYPPPPPPHNLP